MGNTIENLKKKRDEIFGDLNDEANSMFKSKKKMDY